MKTPKQWIAAAMAAALAVTAASCSAIKNEKNQETPASGETLTETPATVPGAAETTALSETTAAVPETAATAALSAAQGTAETAAPPAGATAAVSAATATPAPSSPLTNTQLKELLLKASDFYKTWIVAGPPVDYSGDYESKEIKENGRTYLPSLRQDFTTVEQIGAMAETVFSEEFRATNHYFKEHYWENLYLTVDGVLYADYASGQGGDVMPDAYSIEVVSADENYCRFNLLSIFKDGLSRAPSELTHTFTVIKERGIWVFTGDFPYILSQDASWDC